MVMAYITYIKSGATKTYHGDGEWCRLVRMYGHEYRYAYMSLPMQYAGYWLTTLGLQSGQTRHALTLVKFLQHFCEIHDNIKSII